MANHSSALMSLCECLRGALPAPVDWISLIGLANETLTTPALIGLVRQFERQIPDDVCAYVRDIHKRNLTRNDRLAVQLEETIVALNEAEVTPVLLKGAATLAAASRQTWGARLMADLDLLVARDQAEAHRWESPVGMLALLVYELRGGGGMSR